MKIWVATDASPLLDDWLEGQIEEAVKQYIMNGTIGLKMEEPSIVEFCAGHPLDEYRRERTILRMVTEELEMYMDRDGILQLTPQTLIGFQKLKVELSEAHALLIEKMFTAEIDHASEKDGHD